MNLKSFFIYVSTLLCSNTIMADDGEVVPFFDLGGSLMSVQTTDIKLESETIDVYLHDFMMWCEPFVKEFDKAGSYDVEVNYKFLNTNNEREVMLGFPSASYGSWHIFDYKAYVDGVQKSTELKPCIWGPMDTIPEQCCPGMLFIYGCDAAEVCTAQFKGHSITNVKNTFSNYYDSNSYDAHYNLHTYDGNSYGGHYILHTGASWKDSINEVVFRLHTEQLSEYSKFWYDVENMIVEYGNTRGEYKDGIYTIVLKNIEPVNDFYFAAIEKEETKPLKKKLWDLRSDVPVFVSSTLNPSSNKSYEFYNLGDGDNSTAWVEGENGYGEGSRIIYDLRMAAKEDCDASYIDSITIVNGYAKNDVTFKNNSRVKDIEISFLQYSSESNRYIEKKHLFTLKDTSKPQTFYFNRQEANWMTIEIKSVYPGFKYKDTAISEIKFFSYDLWNDLE